MTSNGADTPEERPAPGRSPEDATDAADTERNERSAYTDTPIYAQLVALWRAQGREVPRPPHGPALPRPAQPPDFFGRG
ncbi:hypothetical protein [Streptomyces sp. NPDC058739]|uniref:hypothetical protein n=1 Tax=Streptomyces sp. NPDC058739 TaxID=3346618 RepID=UPI00369EC924